MSISLTSFLVVVFYMPLAYNDTMKENYIPQVVAETPTYLKAVNALWDEQTQIEFKNFISLNPYEGDIIPGTGGIRKVRWHGSGHGKRGGVRVVYYVYNENNPIYLLFAYPKNVKENISDKEKKILAEIVTELKHVLRSD